MVLFTKILSMNILYLYFISIWRLFYFTLYWFITLIVILIRKNQNALGSLSKIILWIYKFLSKNKNQIDMINDYDWMKELFSKTKLHTFRNLWWFQGLVRIESLIHFIKIVDWLVGKWQREQIWIAHIFKVILHMMREHLTFVCSWLCRNWHRCNSWLYEL